MRPRTARRLLLAALALIAAVSTLGVIFIRLGADARPAPDFTLTDSSGVPFRLSHHLGHVVALYFGYTHCPDVCPTTLASLARAKHELGAEGNALDVAFITVDPARDTPAVMTRYVHLFDRSFFGLSGTPAQLQAVYAAYHIYHQQLPSGSTSTGYDVAHSSGITLIGPDGRIRATGDWDDSSTRLAAEIRRSLA
jgi:protein SCO1/2